MADTRQEYYNTGDDDFDYEGGGNGVVQKAQVFTAVGSHTIGSVKLLLARSFTPSTITVSIRATSSSKPTGDDLCSETFDGDTLTTDTANGEWKQITFSSPITTVDGTKYAIVVKSVDTYYCWRQDDSSPSYTGGTLCGSGDSGEPWTT